MKKFYSLIAVVGGMFAGYAQPANDDCAGAIPVAINADYSCAIVQPGTLAGATASNVPDNGAGTPNDDVWFSFVATNTTHRFSMLNRQGDQTDLVHEIMGGICSQLSSMNISDPETSTVSGFVVGQTYYVRVFNYYSTPALTTTFDLCIGTPPAPPANDYCENAVEVPVNAGLQCTSTVPGTVAGALASNVPDNGAGNPDDDVWFRFTATATSHAISLTNIQGTPTDMVHEVMSGNCGAPVSLLISDPNSSVATGLTIGATYFIRVFTYGSTAGDTTFNVCVTTPPTMTNDECSTAVALSVNTDLSCGSVTAGTLSGSTPSNVPDNGAGTPDDDVWFSFVATAASHKIELLNVSGTPSDLVHEVLSGGCNALASVSISDPNSSTVSGLVAGNTYYVRVFSYAAGTTSTTNFNICVGSFPPPPANDECASAIAITPAGTLGESLVNATIGGATASANIPAPGCASYSGGDVWFTATIPSSGNLTIETAASQGVTTFDSGMAVYSGTCDNLALVSCDDDGADTDNFSKLVLNGRTPGEVVYIRVWEYLNDESEPFSIGAYDASLSTASFDSSALKVYPNPTRDVLNLSYSSAIDSVEVYNLVGQNVIAKQIGQTEYALNLASLPAGTYLVKLNTQDGSKTVKVLKN